MNFNSVDLKIGTGESVRLNNLVFNQYQTFSGSIDDFRVYHGERSEKIQEQQGHRNVLPSKSLRLYFKFNEPSGSYNLPNICLDASSNSLHSKIINFSGILNTFYVSQAAVVSVFMGATAYSKSKNGK